MSKGMSGANAVTPARLAELARLDTREGAASLQADGLWRAATAWTLAQAALDRAEVDTGAASVWLALAMALAADLGDDARLRGQIAYAQARVAVHQGELARAEELLRAAQAAWQEAGDESLLARNQLGLTQVLAMQGRYAEAEEAVNTALAWLGQAGDEAETLVLLSRGQRNLATLQVYQDRHAGALTAYAAARATLTRLLVQIPEPDQGALRHELGHVALNAASAYTFLDNPAQAERELLSAIDEFGQSGDRVNRGRAQANLARLYARGGDYAAALTATAAASLDLLDEGEGPVAADEEEGQAARQMADELLLEQALVYVALNLLPEAARSLDACEQLFRSAGQPYELAQTRYTQGLVAVRRQEWDVAAAALAAALAGYASLGNVYWQNRTRVALAQVALLRRDQPGALAWLDELPTTPSRDAAVAAIAWDRPTLAEAWLVRLRLALQTGDVSTAQTAADTVAQILTETATAEASTTHPATLLPPLSLRLLHARGILARLRGQRAEARAFLAAAADIVEAQRAALPVDEVRVAFLDDKTEIYADWVVTLLETPEVGEDEIAAAFAVVERARARALLERLMAVLSGETAAPSAGQEAVAADETLRIRREALRGQLAELYTRLISESDSRALSAELTPELARQEALLQTLEWRTAAIPAMSLPVTLSDLQARLHTRQQALVYYLAGDEVLAFVVDKQGAQVVRSLCTLDELNGALADLRFQLGRMEMAPTYLARHASRLLRGTTLALGRLYELLLKSLSPLLWADECVVMPYGALHLVPFHALWDGARYLVERCQVVYAPSAAVLVHGGARRPAASGRIFRRFSGLAPTDAHIPAAGQEVLTVAGLFSEAYPLVGERATLAGLQQMIGSVDVLHLATHGLYRVDNAFFSSLKLADGWLDVRAIYRLRTEARLVVLSACESGNGAVRGGDEVIGLARAFLATGAESVIASLWNVHDRSAAALMEHLYEHLLSAADVTPAAALCHAQRRAIAQALHPYYWAPFVTIGESMIDIDQEWSKG